MTLDEPVLRATAPGRVNLIGDHTDYMAGLALPMTIQMNTVIEGTQLPGRIRLVSDSDPAPLDLVLPVWDARNVTPAWGRYVAGVAQLADPPIGIDGHITTTLPVGAGLSSSAALEVATALVLGVLAEPIEVAALCQHAENIATGVPSGIMDQLVIAASEPDTATCIDFESFDVRAVRVPDDFAFWVIDSGQRRSLVDSGYAERRRQAEAAAEVVGPLRLAGVDALDDIPDRVLRARARHVVTECARVIHFSAAMAEGDRESAGRLMDQSHASLRDDYDVSTPQIERLVAETRGRAGVHGVRLTGAGFGGCVVALADPDVTLPGWRVRPSGPARLEII